MTVKHNFGATASTCCENNRGLSASDETTAWKAWNDDSIAASVHWEKKEGPQKRPKCTYFFKKKFAFSLLFIRVIHFFFIY